MQCDAAPDQAKGIDEKESVAAISELSNQETGEVSVSAGANTARVCSVGQSFNAFNTMPAEKPSLQALGVQSIARQSSADGDQECAA